MKVYDYTCDCGHELTNHVVDSEHENVHCPKCEMLMKRCHPACHQFTTTVPTYPGSKALKAGHVHKFGNRPAEKTQIGYGGSVSKGNPTGGGKGGEA